PYRLVASSCRFSSAQKLKTRVFSCTPPRPRAPPSAPPCPGSRTMIGCVGGGAGDGLAVFAAYELAGAVKADGSHGFSSIVSRAAGSPSTIDLAEIWAGQAVRARSMTIRDLP